MNIVVYSAIFGGYDVIRPPLNPNPDIHYVLFTDRQASIPVWDVRVVQPIYSRRKEARWHKILAHERFPDADYTIWVDGWLQLLKDPVPLLSFLGNNDIAMETHIERDCIYAETREVIRVRKADQATALQQVRRYKAEGYPEHNGLTSTYLMVRKNTKRIAELERLWWSEVDQFTLRDQLSFMYCCWRLGIDCSRIPNRNGFYTSHPHAKSY